MRSLYQKCLVIKIRLKVNPEERRRRAKMILKKTYLEQYKQMGLQKSLPANVLNEMRRKSIEQTLEDMRYYNLFNF